MQDLYTPDVTLSDVALPEEHRQLLLNTFTSFEQFQKVRVPSNNQPIKSQIVLLG